MPSADMNKRMTAILYTKGNEVCADCPAKRPLWVSFFINPVEEDRRMAVLCCPTCAQLHHFELGEKRTMIKYLKMCHEWDMDDISNLEDSGNAFVNEVFEANLTEDDFVKSIVLDDKEKEQKKRSKFIKHKYKKRKFFDEVVYHKRVLEVLQKKHEQRRKQAEESRKEKRKDQKSSKGYDTGDDSSSSRHSDDRTKLKDSRNKMRGRSSSSSNLIGLYSGGQETKRSNGSLASMGSSRGGGSTSSLRGEPGESEPKSRPRRGMAGKAHSMRNLAGMSASREKRSGDGGRSPNRASSGSFHVRSDTRSGKRGSMS